MDLAKLIYSAGQGLKYTEYPQHYLLKTYLSPLGDFNQTCYMASFGGKGVLELVCMAVDPSVPHTISNISTMDRDFVMACH